MGLFVQRFWLILGIVLSDLDLLPCRTRFDVERADLPFDVAGVVTGTVDALDICKRQWGKLCELKNINY